MKSVLLTTALVTALSIVALATRAVALMLPLCYGLHAALFAPLLAGASTAVMRFDEGSRPIILALAILALFLGAMRPLQMGFPFLIAAMLATIAAAVGRKHRTARSLGVALLPSCLLYPATVAIGWCTGSFLPNSALVPTVILIALATAAACVFAVSLLAKREFD